MPLANKEVVHLKTGWEKIQVHYYIYNYYIRRCCCCCSRVYFISRSLVSLPFFLLCVVYKYV